MLFLFCACNTADGKDGDKKDTTVPTPGSDGVLSVCLSSEPENLDPALNSSVDGATLISHLFSGLAKWELDDSGALSITADCCEELSEGVVNDDGTVTYTYTLREGLKWSDGKSVTAADFVYSWQRAASPALSGDYHNMFEVVSGYADMWSTKKEELRKDINGLDCKAIDERTLEVTIVSALPYWNELLAYPTYFPVREDVVSNGKWATNPETFICNGPYRITEWKHGRLIVMEKNENYYGRDEITQDKIEFHLSDDQEIMLRKYEDGEWQFIDNVPVKSIPTLKEERTDEFVVSGQIGTYYVNWNANKTLLPESSPLKGAEREEAEAQIRRALGLLIDRNHIVEQISQAGELPASSFVAMGMTDSDGSQFYWNAGESEEHYGYYDVSKTAYEENYNSAVDTLKKYYSYNGEKFTDFPTVEYIYDNSDTHKKIGEYLQGLFGGLGIKLQLKSHERTEFFACRQAGEYTLSRNGWIADYNDPICFLDMWVSNSGNNDVGFGKEGHAEVSVYDLDLTPFGFDVKVEDGTWEDTYDVLIDTVKGCTDDNVRYSLMHIAEDMLMETGCIVPVYFYTDIYMIKENVEGFYSNPLGFKYFMYCSVRN